MTCKLYFFDSCALVDYIFGQDRFQEYKDAKIITTMLNLLELHYVCTKMKSKDFADRIFEDFLEETIPVDPLLIPEVSSFRLKNIKKQFSYIDCVGYIIALKNNLKFLTSDGSFKGMKNVEFV